MMSNVIIYGHSIAYSFFKLWYFQELACYYTMNNCKRCFNSPRYNEINKNWDHASLQIGVTFAYSKQGQLLFETSVRLFFGAITI